LPWAQTLLNSRIERNRFVTPQYQTFTMNHEHWIPGKECPLPNCYTKYEIPGYKEIWGLYIYTEASENGFGERSRLGELVHDLKYENQPISSYDNRIDELEKYTAWFIERMLLIDFDLIVTVPVNRQNSVSVPKLVSRKLNDRGLAKGFISLRKIAPVRVLKSITLLEERLKEVLGAYEFMQPYDEVSQKRVLVLDDVIESGSTLQAAVTAVLEKWPKAIVYGIAFTFVKDFKVKP
jgi:predicted amidophosphoribosyltransferase